MGGKPLRVVKLAEAKRATEAPLGEDVKKILWKGADYYPFVAKEYKAETGGDVRTMHACKVYYNPPRCASNVSIKTHHNSR